jgi:DNA polymerase I
MKHLILDANNLLFRARHSCYRRSYDHVIVHTFFRSVKPIVEKFSPDCVYFVLDGYPKKRMKMQPDYKGTREYHDKDNFNAQRKQSIKMIKDSVPFLVMRHAEMEADDVIADLSLRLIPQKDEKIVVSSDTDFIQLCQDASNLKLYNPIKKDYREPPEYPYAEWKALRGDGADNIQGIRGIGNKRAAQLLTKPGALDDFFSSRDVCVNETYKQNLKMIKLEGMTDDEYAQVEMSFAQLPLKTLRSTFTDMDLKSMITDKAWNNYSGPFKELRDGRRYFTC